MQCVLSGSCKNSTDLAGEQASKCALCRLSPDNAGRNMSHFWKPVIAKQLHPKLVEEKRSSKIAKRILKLTKKNSADKNKRKISRLAAKAEKQTEKQIIHATKNSGRSNKDGDHVLYKSITLDTKLQTTRSNPIIKLDELEKVRRDAVRANMMAGGLLIRNKHGVGVVVFREEDVPNICNVEKDNA